MATSTVGKWLMDSGKQLHLRAKRKSGSVKFLSNEKEYTILSLFLWVEGGEEV